MGRSHPLGEPALEVLQGGDDLAADLSVTSAGASRP